MVNGVLKYTERKCLSKKRMTANLNVRKIYSVVERMDGCEYSLEIIIVPLKEHITEAIFFLK